jgi:branched-chain amino acid transport system substrate-binding protein
MRKWAFIVGLVTVLWLATGVYCPLQAQGSEEIIRIGGFAPFTGPVADVGQQIREGIELAAKHMEKEGIIINGKPHKIQLFWGDTESKPEVGLSVVEKLITVNRIHAGVGFYHTAIFLRVMDRFQEYKIPVLDADATTTTIYKKIAEKKMEYCFQFSNTNDDMVRSMTEFLAKVVKRKRVALLMENNESGREHALLTKQNFNELDPEVKFLTEDYVSLGVTDMTPELAKIKNAGADLIVSTMSGAPAGAMLEQWAELRVPALFALYGTDVVAENFIAAHPQMERSIVMNRWWPGDYSPISKMMLNDYAEQYKRSATVFAIQSYDATRIIIEAAKKANSLDAKAIRDAIAQNKFVTVWGERYFLPLDRGQRSPVEYAAIVQIVNGKKVPVWPAKIKAAEVLPVPPWPWTKR